MSLLSSVILPVLEKELANAAPEVIQFFLNQAGNIAEEIAEWLENKIADKLNPEEVEEEAQNE